MPSAPRARRPPSAASRGSALDERCHQCRQRTLHDHRGLCVLDRLEQLGERRFASVFLVGLWDFSLRFDDILGQDEKALEKVNRGKNSLFVLETEIFKAF